MTDINYEIDQKWIGDLSMWLHEHLDCGDQPYTDDEACGVCWETAKRLAAVVNGMFGGQLEAARASDQEPQP